MGGLYPGAPEFDKESVVYYPYDIESAKALLADLGLKDNDGDGVWNGRLARWLGNRL